MNSQMGKPFFAYRSFWKDFETVRRFAETGVKEYCVFAGNTANSLGEPYSQYETVWKWFDAYDFTPFEEQMTDLLRIVPDARVICLIDLNSPLWLARQMHLDSYFQLGNALANQEWRKRTEQYVSAFTEYAQKNYGERIIAYVLMCGKTDEWMDHANGDETVEKLLLYQEWCRQNAFPVPNEIPSVLRRENATVNSLQMAFFISPLWSVSFCGRNRKSGYFTDISLNWVLLPFPWDTSPMKNWKHPL